MDGRASQEREWEARSDLLLYPQFLRLRTISRPFVAFQYRASLPFAGPLLTVGRMLNFQLTRFFSSDCSQMTHVMIVPPRIFSLIKVFYSSGFPRIGAKSMTRSIFVCTLYRWAAGYLGTWDLLATCPLPRCSGFACSHLAIAIQHMLRCSARGRAKGHLHPGGTRSVEVYQCAMQLHACIHMEHNVRTDPIANN